MNQIKSYTNQGDYNPTGDWDCAVVSLWHLPQGEYLINMLHYNGGENTETVMWVKNVTDNIKHLEFRYKPFWGGGFSTIQNILIRNNDTQITAYVKTPSANTHTSMYLTAIFLHDIE